MRSSPIVDLNFSLTNLVFSGRVKEDSSLKLPAGAEKRRVFSVDQVSVEKTDAI